MKNWRRTVNYHSSVCASHHNDWLKNPILVVQLQEDRQRRSMKRNPLSWITFMYNVHEPPLWKGHWFISVMSQLDEPCQCRSCDILLRDAFVPYVVMGISSSFFFSFSWKCQSGNFFTNSPYWFYRCICLMAHFSNKLFYTVIHAVKYSCILQEKTQMTFARRALTTEKLGNTHSMQNHLVSQLIYDRCSVFHTLSKNGANNFQSLKYPWYSWS